MSSSSQANSDDIEQRKICAECVGEPFLRSEIARAGTHDQCHYCKAHGNTWTLIALASRVETAFEDHFDRTSDQPDALESMMHNDSESNYNWERKGDQATYAIANAAVVDEAIAEDIRQILAERHFDFEDAKMSLENEFDDNSHYAKKSPDDAEFQDEWNQFERNLQTEGRFFNSLAQETLGRIFERLDAHRTEAGNPVVVCVGPEKQITSFFRARVFQSEDKLREAIMRPDLEIGPPPPTHAIARRMNASGIAVFYGTRDLDTALSEVRPPVGSHVVTARFDLLRPLRLLDVEALREVFVEGSIFDSTYLQRLQHAIFLGSLGERMSRVVLPVDERNGYLVTQAVADYLANVVKLDGVLYRSVQVDHGSANVVLFHHAARVEPISGPNTEFDATLYLTGEEGPEPMFTVWEDVPNDPLAASPKAPFELATVTSLDDSLIGRCTHTHTESYNRHCRRALCQGGDLLDDETPGKQAFEALKQRSRAGPQGPSNNWNF